MTAFGILLVRRWFRRSRRESRKTRLLLCTGFSSLSLFFLLVDLYWVAASRFPCRCPKARWVFGVSLLDIPASSRQTESGPLTAATVLLLAFQAPVLLQGGWEVATATIPRSPSKAVLEEPIAEVLSTLPPGLRVLFFAHKAIRDYPSFRLLERFTKRVVSWGDDLPTLDRVLQPARSTSRILVLCVTSPFARFLPDLRRASR
jgi:hypothetical protein